MSVQVPVVEKAASNAARAEARVEAIVGDGFDVTKFVENFEAMAEAEGGLKRLRELAIELAVRGLLLEGADPSSWKRVLLSDVAADFQNGISKRTGDAGRAIPVLRLADIDRGSRIRGEGLREILLTASEEEKYRVAKGDILVIRVNGSADLVGRFVPCDVSREWAYSDHLIRVRPHANLVDMGFLCSVARSAASRAHVVSNTVTTAGQRTINQVGLGSLPLLLPPLAEQKRIVARVDQLVALIDELEVKQARKREVSARFAQASLEALANAEAPAEFDAVWKRVVENWETALDRAEKVAELRAAILQLAVVGKLVDLVDAPHAATSSVAGGDENTRIKLPPSWRWVKLGQVAELINGDRSKNYPNKAEYVRDGVAWINTGHIEPNGTLSLRDMHYISRGKFDSLRSGKVRPGDLVYCLRGATLGKTAIITQFTEGAVASSLVIIRLSPAVEPAFAYRVLTSPLGRDQIFRFDNGSAQPNLSANNVKKYWIPLPPLSEQRRIVAKVEHLMKLCDDLEAKLRRAEDQASKLVEAAVREMVA